MSFRERWIDGSWALFAVTCVFSVSLAQAAIVLMILGWLVGGRFAHSRGLRAPLVLPYLVFLVLSVVSALAADRPLEALRAMGSEWLPLALFVVALDAARSRDRVLRLLRWWLASGALSACLGLVHYLAPGVLHVARTGNSLRIRGTVGHYMTLAGLMMFLGLFALALLIHQRRRSQGIWVSGALLLSGSAMMLTQVRSAWVAFVTGAVGLLWLRRRRWIWFVPIVALLAFSLGPSTLRHRAATLLDPNNATIVERTYFWRVAVEIIGDHPLLGVGPHRVAKFYADHRHPDDPRLPWNPFTHLHSTPLQLAAERGLPALGVWIWFWVVFFFHAVRAYRRLDTDDRDGRSLSGGALACALGFLVWGLFEFNYGDSEVIQVVVALLALPFIAGRNAGEPSAPIQQKSTKLI